MRVLFYLALAPSHLSVPMPRASVLPKPGSRRRLLANDGIAVNLNAVFSGTDAGLGQRILDAIRSCCSSALAATCFCNSPSLAGYNITRVSGSTGSSNGEHASGVHTPWDRWVHDRLHRTTSCAPLVVSSAPTSKPSCRPDSLWLLF